MQKIKHYKHAKKSTVIMINKSKFKVLSTKSSIVLENDFTVHPAWSISKYKIDTKINQFKIFKKRFGDLFV